MTSMGPIEAVGGVVILAFTVFVSLLLGFLLFVSPLMIWLNLRRLRINLHEDLTALRNSLDRSAGVPPPAAEPEAGEARSPAAENAEPPSVPAPTSDKIGFSCPECGKFFEGPAKLAGTDHVCPECNAGFHIH